MKAGSDDELIYNEAMKQWEYHSKLREEMSEWDKHFEEDQQKQTNILALFDNRENRLRSFYHWWDRTPDIATMPQHYQDMMVLKEKRRKDQTPQGRRPGSVKNAWFYLPIYLLRNGTTPEDVITVMTTYDAQGTTPLQHPFFNTPQGREKIKDLRNIIRKEENGEFNKIIMP